MSKYIDAVNENQAEYEALLCPPSKIHNIHELLKDAAYFANYVLCYSRIRCGMNHKKTLEKHSKFMPEELFRKVVDKSIYQELLQ